MTAAGIDDAKAEVNVGGGEDEREERPEDQAADGELFGFHGPQRGAKGAMGARGAEPSTRRAETIAWVARMGIPDNLGRERLHG